MSVSLGAFLAGLVISESRASTHVLAEVLPLQIIFSAVFFVSVGMLLDLGFVLDNAVLVLGAAVVVLVAKALTAGAAAAAARVPPGRRRPRACCWRRSASSPSSCSRWAPPRARPLGRSEDGSQLVVATTVLLMLGSPALAAAAARVDRPGGGPAPAGPGRRGEVVDHDAPFRNHVVIIGWRPTALDLAETLRQRGVPVVLTTLNPDGAAEAEAAGLQVVRGDPTKAAILRAAGVPTARLVVVAEDGHEQAFQVISAARALASVPIVTRPWARWTSPRLAEAEPTTSWTPSSPRRS